MDKRAFGREKKIKQKKNVEELPKVQATTPCGSRRIESDTVLMRIDPFGLGDDTDGLEAFTIDESTGTIRTKVTLDHEERAFYRLAVSVKDHGRPPKETVRQLQIEVLDLNDNRPTFSTSSFAFKVSHVTRAGHDGFSLSLSSHAPFGFSLLLLLHRVLFLVSSLKLIVLQYLLFASRYLYSPLCLSLTLLFLFFSFSCSFIFELRFLFFSSRFIVSSIYKLGSFPSILIVCRAFSTSSSSSSPHSKWDGELKKKKKVSKYLSRVSRTFFFIFSPPPFKYAFI